MTTRKFLNRLIVAIALAVAIVFAASFAAAQTPDAAATAQPPADVAQENELAKAKAAGESKGTATPTPVFTNYRNIEIGMAADDVRNKLGNLREKGETQDFFVLSDREMAQVFYDAQGKVRAISIDYMGKDSNAPAPMRVLGEDLQANADGSMYLLKRYPVVGYWVSYNRTAGDDPTVTITMQRMTP